MDYRPLGAAAVVFENFLISSTVVINLVLLVIFSVSIEASEFLVLPLIIEWFSLVIVSLYLLVRETRAPGTPPSLPKAIIMFSSECMLGLVTSLALTIRAWPGSTLCDDFGNLADPCSVALAVIGLSWVSATTAFIGILLSCSGPVCRLYQGLRARHVRRPKRVNQNQHAIELDNMPSSYQARNSIAKEGWTDIPF